jgi:lipopolysaccharide transport system permease protein
MAPLRSHVTASSSSSRRPFELARYYHLLARLVARDIRIRYKRSVLGIVWALAEPLVTMTLFTVVFSLFMRVDTPRYPAFVLCGILVWSFSQTGVTYALTSVSGNRNLVKKIYFPREILPLATVLGRLVHFLLSLLLLVPFLVYFRVPLSANLAFLPLLVLVQLGLVTGLALLFSALSTLYEDVGFLVTFAFSGLFYLSPVFYPVELVPAGLRTLYLLNPFAALITAYRAVILQASPPPWLPLGAASVTATLVLAAGYAVFKRLEWIFAEVL